MFHHEVRGGVRLKQADVRVINADGRRQIQWRVAAAGFAEKQQELALRIEDLTDLRRGVHHVDAALPVHRHAFLGWGKLARQVAAGAERAQMPAFAVENLDAAGRRVRDIHPPLRVERQSNRHVQLARGSLSSSASGSRGTVNRAIRN